MKFDLMIKAVRAVGDFWETCLNTSLLIKNESSIKVPPLSDFTIVLMISYSNVSVFNRWNGQIFESLAVSHALGKHNVDNKFVVTL